MRHLTGCNQGDGGDGHGPCTCHLYRKKYSRKPSKESQRLARIVAMSQAMANDEGLWFQAQTCAEAYLQQELRKLMHVIEDTP